MKCAYRHCSVKLTKQDRDNRKLYCCPTCKKAEHAEKRREYYHRVVKEHPPLQILCPCGCWNFFFFNKKRPQRKFFKAYPCRHIHERKLRQVEGTKPQVISKPREKGLPCHKTVMGNEDRKIACADYSECLEGVALGEVWKCSDGVNRYREPHEVQVNTIGSSLARCQSRSYGVG